MHLKRGVSLCLYMTINMFCTVYVYIYMTSKIADCSDFLFEQYTLYFVYDNINVVERICNIS